MNYNIITVAFGALRKVTALPINYKYDIGQILRITGLELPESYVVDFCNQGDSTTISMVGTADGVRIPDEFLQTGKPVKAYVVLSGADNTQTRYEITIPVNARPERTDIQPTPEEQSTIDSLIAAMNNAVEESGENADRAESEADRAATEADRAEQAAESIGDKVERAEAAAQAAGVSATRAEDAAEDAEGYRDEAEQSAGSATSSAEDARNSKETAIEKAAEAEQSAAQAAASAASIEGDVAEAEQAAQTATQAATNAEDAKDAANLFARNAAESAEAAHLSEVSAEDSASTATAKAAEASASATAAQTAQTGAETAQTAAEAAQQAAEEAAQEAATILVDKAPIITDTASGAIASFPDGADGLPLKSLVASIEPVQDLHGYDSPWPDGGGVNKINFANCTAGKTAFGLTSAMSGEYFRFTGTCSSGGAHTWVFGTVDSAQQEKIGNLNLKGFVISGGSALAITSIAYNSSNGALSIKLGGLVTNQSYDFLIGVVAYEGSTAPTVWTPYSNECPISGWTGAEIEQTGGNLAEMSAENIVVGKYIDNNGAEQTSLPNFYYSKHIPAKPSTEYTMKISQSVSYFSYMEYDASKGFLKRTLFGSSSTPAGDTITITTRSDTAYLLFGANIDTTNVNISRILAINWDLYEQKSLSVNWEDSAGTVYGGTLAIDEDGGCALTATYADVDLGTLDWNISDGRFNTLTPISNAKGGNHADCLCSIYKSDVGAATRAVDCSICFANNGYVYIYDTTFSGDASAFKAAMNGVQLVYYLATPITYTLPDVTMLSSLLGTNNIWVDTGDTTVEYRADTKKYIQKIIAQALNS